MLTGYIEGYYGLELSWKERNSIISKLHEVGCNTYFYCPKEDPYHRVRWKDDYPVSWIEEFKEFKSIADIADTSHMVSVLVIGLSLIHI